MSSRKNIAGALSRLTKIPASDQSQEDDGYIRMVALHAVHAALRIKEIKRIQHKIQSCKQSEIASLKKNGTMLLVILASA